MSIPPPMVQGLGSWTLDPMNLKLNPHSNITLQRVVALALALTFAAAFGCAPALGCALGCTFAFDLAFGLEGFLHCSLPRASQNA